MTACLLLPWVTWQSVPCAFLLALCRPCSQEAASCEGLQPMHFTSPILPAVPPTQGRECCIHQLRCCLAQGMAKGGPAASYIPILATELSTWEAARRLAATSPAILPTSSHKIQEAKVGTCSACTNFSPCMIAGDSMRPAAGSLASAQMSCNAA